MVEQTRVKLVHITLSNLKQITTKQNFLEFIVLKTFKVEKNENYSRIHFCNFYKQMNTIFFCVYGSMHRWSLLITVQRDATQSSLFIILQVHSTRFGCQPHPSYRVNKNCNHSLRYWSATSLQHSQPRAWPRWREVASCKKKMTSTGGCSYSFVYSWWWVWLTPETRRVNLRNNK